MPGSQLFQWHEGDSAALSLLQMFTKHARSPLVVNDVVEQAGPGHLFDGQSVELDLDVYQLRDSSIGSRDVPLALQAAYRGKATRCRIVHALAELALGSLHVRPGVAEHFVEHLLLSPEPLPLLL